MKICLGQLQSLMRCALADLASRSIRPKFCSGHSSITCRFLDLIEKRSSVQWLLWNPPKEPLDVGLSAAATALSHEILARVSEVID
jgi:hypothetical protein